MPNNEGRQQLPAPERLSNKGNAESIRPTAFEEWRAIPGYVGVYEVSDLGRIRSLDRTMVSAIGHATRRTGQLISPARDSKGHLVVSLYGRDHTKRSFRVHRLILAAFAGPCPPGHEALHRNSRADDNRLANLTWGTPADLGRLTVQNGRHPMARRTHCAHGHGYTPGNTRIVRRSEGRTVRACRACLAIHGRRPQR
ncbi:MULTISPECIES: NUMOD4 domain-containing protein [unclassified Gordonia (in: high G+C Gram-positive bacteria)]|uniref:NUMOD4 domain-containing protein n=1 Tax=unclassified Gordonia (in: high G+C Gram-positive bacteria) TaxID=2657482 RepID=UPI001CFADC98|nr:MULTISPECIES: NUMOD4 domain-containing protein [unclassified Gordonia (in: high G+C Gram-positive bacteria)]MCT1353840.1 NUMOD4 motif-containing HNH endonuclease [Gordonia sp. p3-SID1431]UCZ91268.1 NUMOD4 motif-containing HNH endonuclease [Gordonia sp. WA4-43]